MHHSYVCVMLENEFWHENPFFLAGILFMCCCRLPQMYTDYWPFYGGLESLWRVSEWDSQLKKEEWGGKEGERERERLSAIQTEVAGSFRAETLVWLWKDSIFLSPQVRLVFRILFGTFWFQHHLEVFAQSFGWIRK